jgi:putative addiction module component (TIGR02574 family)
MSSPARKLYEEALQLPPDERVQLMVDLLSSLESEPDEDVEASWIAEVERRVRTSDPADDLAWDDVRRDLHRDPRA